MRDIAYEKGDAVEGVQHAPKLWLACGTINSDPGVDIRLSFSRRRFFFFFCTFILLFFILFKRTPAHERSARGVRSARLNNAVRGRKALFMCFRHLGNEITSNYCRGGSSHLPLPSLAHPHQKERVRIYGELIFWQVRP